MQATDRRREPVERRRGMTPEEIEDDKKRLNRRKARRWRENNPEKERLQYLASGGSHHPARRVSRKASEKIHRIKDILIREFVGEKEYAELLEQARVIFQNNENEIPESFKKKRFRRSDWSRD